MFLALAPNLNKETKVNKLNKLLNAFINHEQYTFSNPCRLTYSNLLGRQVFVIDSPDRYATADQPRIRRILVATNRTSDDFDTISYKSTIPDFGVMLELVGDEQFGDMSALIMADEILIWTEKTTPCFINLEGIETSKYSWIVENIFPEMRNA